MSSTGLATVAEFEDEERHIIAPPPCPEHHLHHHHHREEVGFRGGTHYNVEAGGKPAIASGEEMVGEEHGEIIITATQKMLSACIGSLLTSLLVTPLDVVRVRLQAQHASNAQEVPSTLTPSSSRSPSMPLRVNKLPIPPLEFQSTFARLPPELGVTACCREVFWINNNAEFCVASSSSGSAFTASPAPASSLMEACPVEETSHKKFNGTWEGLVKISRNEGVTSLWRGLSPTLVMAIPANVIYFTGYESLRTSPLSPFSHLNSTWAPLLAGSSARAIAATAISPLELFRTRLWAVSTPKNGLEAPTVPQTGAFKRTALGLVDMVKAEGWTSLWRGLTLTLWRDVPFSGIYWLGYEFVKTGIQTRRETYKRSFPPSAVPRNNEHDNNVFADSFIAGALSGSIAAFLTTPFDVGKTRIQVTQNHSPPPPPTAGPTVLRAGFGPYIGGSAAQKPAVIYKSMPSLLHGIFKQEGIRGLWRGCVPRMLKVAPACAIMISTYEVGKQWADKMNARKRERRESMI